MHSFKMQYSTVLNIAAESAVECFSIGLMDLSFLTWTCEFAPSPFPLFDSALWGRTLHDNLDSRLTGAAVISKQIKAVRRRKRETLQRNPHGTPLFHCAQQVCHLICSFNPVLTPVRVLNKIVSHVCSFFPFCFSSCAFLQSDYSYKKYYYGTTVIISDGKSIIHWDYPINVPWYWHIIKWQNIIKWSICTKKRTMVLFTGKVHFKCCLYHLCPVSLSFLFPFSFSFPLKRGFPFFRGGGLTSLLKGIPSLSDGWSVSLNV